MLEYVSHATTVADLPVGTRVVRRKGQAVVGTVVGHYRDSVSVRWDNGGYSSAPAGHGLWIVVEHAEAAN